MEDQVAGYTDSIAENEGIGVFIEENTSCASGYPRTSAVSSTDRCTHKLEFSNNSTKVATCLAYTNDETCKADTNCALAPIPVKICFMGNTYNQVRFLPNTSTSWFSGDDNFNGNIEIGIQGDTTAEWAIKFNTLDKASIKFLFAQLNFKNWIYTTSAFMNYVNGEA